MSGRPSASQLIASLVVVVMIATFSGSGSNSEPAQTVGETDTSQPAPTGVVLTMPASLPRLIPAGAAQPIPSGTTVVHEFDVVQAHYFDSTGQIPSGSAPMTISESTISSWLADAAQNWSGFTGLVFDFSQNTQYKAINTTCATMETEVMAAFGHPDDFSVYADSNRTLMILNIDAACDQYGGEAWTVSPHGDVFAGGIFEMTVDSYSFDSSQAYVATISHEFGHTIGLLHSNILDCSQHPVPGDDHVGVTWDGTYFSDVQDPCPLIEYADYTTIMGTNGPGLNSLQKWYLGVASDVEILDEPIQTTITLNRHDVNDPDFPRGAVISYIVDDALAAFGLEYRPSSEILGSNPGVFLTSGLGTGLQTDLLIPPGNRTRPAVGFDKPLEPGQTFISADGQVSIQTIEVDDATAQVQISVSHNPGVEGRVLIRQDGDSLTAVAASVKTTNISYQWFRNGAEIPGAVESSYTPVLPDPNATYRVEVVMEGGGQGPTTRHSRGIIADDQRFTMVGDVATLMFVDDNGQPRDCADRMMAMTVRTSSASLVTHTSTMMSSDSVLGACHSTVDLPVTGHFTLTAELTYDDDQPYTGSVPQWLEPYWEPQTIPWTRTTGNATANLFVGSYDDGDSAMHMEVGSSAPPLPVIVSVTQKDGTPATGVPVSITAPAGMIVTPPSPETDSDGVAYAELQWDPRTQPPNDEVTESVGASVPGFAQVQFSPAEIRLESPSQGSLTAWLDKTTAVVDGMDSLTLHLRAWDESGVPIQNQPESLQADILSNEDFESMGTFSEMAWDDVNKEYVTTITPQTVTSGRISVWMLDGPGTTMQLYPIIYFTAGPATGFNVSQMAAVATQNGMCGEDNSGVAEVSVWPVNSQSVQTTLDEPGILFSLPQGSPLAIVGDPTVTEMDSQNHYHVQVTSSMPGLFDVIATSMDHRISQNLTLLFSNGPIDTTSSTFTITDGVRAADGTDSHTVTANLVTQCRVPLVIDLGIWTSEALDLDVHNTDGSVSTGAVASGFLADPDQSGTYTATVAFTEPGAYTAVITFHSTTADGVETTTTVASLPMRFGE